MKRKSPLKTLTERFRELAVFVSIGFVTVVVCSIILIMTYAERKTGAPISYGHSA